MDLASLLMPMLSGGMGAQGSMAGLQPIQQPGTAQQQGSMAPYMNPDQMAQLQTDTLDYQRRNQLANALMSQGYVPNSGKFGMLAGIASMLGGKFAQSQNDSKLSDIIKRQYQAESQAAAAKRAQDLQDLIAKTNVETQGKITEDEAKSKFEKQYQKNVVDNGFVIDPNNPGASVAVPGFSAAQIALAGGKANAEAAARARYAGADSAAQLGQIQKLMAMPDSPVKQAMLTKALGEGGMQSLQMSNMFGGGASGGQGGTVQSGPTGDDFLKGLPPAIAGQVKAIAEGRQAPPTSMALRSPMGQQLMAAVTQYDPTFDATNYGARAGVRNDFTRGKAAQAVNAMNTAIGHAGTLLDAADALNNTPFPILNSALNAGAQAIGDPRIQQFNVARNALAGELTKAFRGSPGSEKDIQEAQSSLNAAGSPEQMKAAIGQAMKLLASKKESLAEQYRKGFGAKSEPNFLDPHAQAALQKLQTGGIDVGALAGDESLPSQAASAQAAPTATATGPNGQKIGLVNGQWVPL